MRRYGSGIPSRRQAASARRGAAAAVTRPANSAKFLMQLREGDPEHPPLSSSSAARTIVAVRGFHKFVVREGLSDSDPAGAVKPPAPPKRLPKALPLGEVEKILDAAGAAGTVLAMRDRALLEVLYGTGARISEAVGLDVDDLDLDQGAVLLRGKGGKQRVVPVGSFAREAVGAYVVASATRARSNGQVRRRDVPELPRRPPVAPVGVGRAEQGG